MKKCLVLDLDNTLWGGLAGEEGINGVSLSLTPPGNSFMAFQQAILDHHDRGIILAINSRNNPDDAWNIIRNHPNMILKENHFAAARINWNDKAQNLIELSKELNIGLDSLVFIDDDPTNRALVRETLPDVLVPELPNDPAEYASFLNNLNCFESKVITDEDKMRGNLYVTERLRKEEEKLASSKEEFLKNLKLKMSFYMDDDSCLPRLAQLTEKTNQFNIDKKPLTESDISRCIKSLDRHVFYARLEDKFGDQGIITFAIVEKDKENWHISSLLMSCRVFGRGVEDAFLGAICNQAKKESVGEISIAFKESPKNTPAKEFVIKYFGGPDVFIKTKLEIPEWIKIIYG